MGCPGCEWDPWKDIENQRKHGVDFEDACCIFEDPFRYEDEDPGEYDEDRLTVFGRVGSILLAVVFTDRNSVNRIISARKAEPREERRYFARFRRPRGA